ncbi:hypothetical protein JW916_14610 [Candidatus Sumerlaeota bacterium]|nr:hypothetical protein [Candidatus Sumerlaeota bacterium]
MSEPDKPPPQDSSPDPTEPIRRARLLWHLCLVLPFVYIGIAEIVDRFLFAPNNGLGLWPMRSDSYDWTIRILIALVVAIQVGVVVLHLVFARRIRICSLIPARAARLYWWRTAAVAACGDTVTFFGLIVFLLSARWPPLLGCCIYAYIVYAQAYPRAHLVEDPQAGEERK